MPKPKTDQHEPLTNSDLITPHENDATPKPVPGAEIETGIVDPRKLPGPEILNPPLPGLPPPSE